MKIFRYTLVLLTLTIWSCKKVAPKVDYVILKGDIKNVMGSELRINSIKRFTKTINIKDTGSVIDTLYIEEGLYSISFEKKTSVNVYMMHGDVISFTADAKDYYKTLIFHGDNSGINNFYVAKAQALKDFRKNAQEIYLLEEGEFEQKIKTFQDDLETKLDQVASISEALRTAEKRAINYNRIENKDMYESFHGYYSKNETFKASEGFKKEVEELDLNNTEDFFFSSDYYLLVSSRLSKEAYEIGKRDSISYEFAELEQASKLENKAIGNQIMFDNVRIQLATTYDKESFLDKFMGLSTNDEHKQKIQDLYNELGILDVGKPSPKFVNYENYAGGTSSLDDLKGKFVYIDVWATWCKPCIYEIPFLEEIENQYRGKGIEFVSISVDNNKDHQVWKNMIAEKEMTGLQLFADKNFNSDFIKAYKINGIPQFILLDNEGNIVQANAPRPSEKKLIELFNEYGI
ncbi:thiol-disulfide isomerase/thioredoxin [Gelidibacter algens]|uniref:Thiol-disulfide isomerase/thioredoxin n=1 Tax=Gelidibacter algens TaxID=49280 RepID=A0A327S7U9_9FLAO|nr:TlpA disulfide reductase family protein [Gelidibacter algens]RAJ25150.1 thiol-disulfide isomerase/thioredoxin [Gelidibacter algens]